MARLPSSAGIAPTKPSSPKPEGHPQRRIGRVERKSPLVSESGSSIEIDDQRVTGEQQTFAFTLELQANQQCAINDLPPHDLGMLVAPPGAGKTVTACAVIATRELPTLVLVDRKPLAEQWRRVIQTHRLQLLVALLPLGGLAVAVLVVGHGGDLGTELGEHGTDRLDAPSQTRPLILGAGSSWLCPGGHKCEGCWTWWPLPGMRRAVTDERDEQRRADPVAVRGLWRVVDALAR